MKEIKLLISIFICCVIFFSCHSNDKGKAKYDEITDSAASSGISSGSTKTIINQTMMWTVDEENS